MRLRVLHVIESLEHGGAERVMVDLANRQAGRYEVAVCCMKRRGELEWQLDPSIVRFCMDKPEGNDFRPSLRLGRLLRQQRFDVVHSHGWGVYLDVGLACAVGGSPGHIHTVHGPYPAPKNGPFGRLMDRARRFLEHSLVRRVHSLVAVSESLAAELQGELGFPMERVTTVHNGVADSSLPATVRDAPDAVRLITVGRLAEIKNQAMMLEALAALRPRYRSLSLTFVGDGPERAALEARAADLALGDSVQFLGYREDIAEQLAAADIFLLTSWHEGISIALLEAMRAGLPAIATRVGGVAETLQDGVSGVLIEPGNVDGLARSIEVLAMSANERRRIGRNAQRRVEEHFSSRAMARCYAALYRDAGGGARSDKTADKAASVAGSVTGIAAGTVTGAAAGTVAGAVTNTGTGTGTGAETGAGAGGAAARPEWGAGSRALRILYHHRTQGRGAEGVHIASIVRALEALGHEVTVVSPAGVDALATAGAAPVDKVDVKARGIGSVWKTISRHLPGFLFELGEIAYNVVAWRSLRRRLASGEFDLVYERYAFYMVAGAWLANRRGIPFVLEINEVSGLPERARRQVFPWLCATFERFLFRRCTAVLPVSSELCEMTIRQGLPPERAWVVPNAIDSAALRPVPRRAELVERYGLGGRTVMGFAGWFDHWDRLELLIGALAALQPEFPELAVLLIGDGPTLAPLRERVERDGQAADVVLAGAVPRAQLHEHLALLDIAVLPHSNRFGSPVVMFEFMARRLPITAPRLPPIEDVLEDGHNALLFDPLDQDGLIAALRRYLSSERLRTRLSDAAYAQLVRRHTWERNAEAIIDAAGFGPATPSTLQVEELRRAG